ncbi:TetR/AcrR family transcriptional regulator [Actinokineospora inagensis]|uniref:TetR/AcrR family transcriptional regulator n=1 Tax=Actinokineospora inagensis TaxID=103730 RepID=UPI000A047659|nr:TetR/AcrR family transcriptional regulator [Actinokineospora inagensis]
MATYASVRGRRQAAVTPARVVAEALALTRSHGVETWTLRQLAAAVQAYPAVIYHHVGDREAVVAAVLDRVARELPLPPDSLPWRTWFERFLTDARPVLRRYPGVARRLAVHGERVPAMHDIVDRGVDVLTRAGFGPQAGPVYTVLVTHALQSIATEDDRDRAALPGPDLYRYGLARLLDGVGGVASQPDTQRVSSPFSSPHPSDSATDS